MIPWYYAAITLAVGFLAFPLVARYGWPALRKWVGGEVAKAGNAIEGKKVP